MCLSREEKSILLSMLFLMPRPKSLIKENKGCGIYEKRGRGRVKN